MSIFSSDAILKSTIELILEDLRSNSWLLDNIFQDFSSNPYLKKKFPNQTKSAKEWFLNNKIFIELGYTTDTVELPRISICINGAKQDTSMSTMADGTPDKVMLLPSQIDKPIPFIVSPFTPVSYDSPSGMLVVPASVTTLYKAVPGQILVNTTTGKGFVIDEISGNTILLNPGSVIGSGTVAILPKNQFYSANIEQIWMNVSYQLICSGLGDAQVAIWLHDILLYGLLRYKEGMLEALGLEESVFESSALGVDENMSDSGQLVWSRSIKIDGKVQQTFIKAPHRIAENAELINTNGPVNNCTTDAGWTVGVEIVSNQNTVLDPDNIWTTIIDENA